MVRRELIQPKLIGVPTGIHADTMFGSTPPPEPHEGDSHATVPPCKARMTRKSLLHPSRYDR